MAKCKALEEYIRDSAPFYIKVNGREEILTVLRILQDKTGLRWASYDRPLEFIPPHDVCKSISIEKNTAGEVDILYSEQSEGVALSQFLSLVEELCPEEQKFSSLEEYLKEKVPVRIYYDTIDEAKQILQILQEHTSFCWDSGHKPLAWFEEKSGFFTDGGNICIEENEGRCFLVHRMSFRGYELSFKGFMDLASKFSSSVSKNKPPESQQEYNRVESLMLSNFL